MKTGPSALSHTAPGHTIWEDVHMAHSRKAYYWLFILLIPFMLGIEQCGTTLFLTGQDSKNSPTEPCLEQIETPTPLQIVIPPQPLGPQGTPVIQDGDVVAAATPIILPSPAPPTPTPTPTPSSGPVCINSSCTPSVPFWCPSSTGYCISSCGSCPGMPNLSTTACVCY